MEKVADKKESGGHLEVFEDFKRNIFLARPHGIINPTLLETDLAKAKKFSQTVKGEWSYMTDTSDVWLVNPFNLMYLKEVKKLPKLKQIIIFAPGSVNRLLIRLASPIVQPDRIIKDEAEFVNIMSNKT